MFLKASLRWSWILKKKNLTQDIPTITGTNCVFVLLELCWWRLCGPRPPALLSLLLQVVFLLRAVHLGCWDVAWQPVVLMRGRRWKVLSLLLPVQHFLTRLCRPPAVSVAPQPVLWFHRLFVWRLSTAGGSVTDWPWLVDKVVPPPC